MKCPKCGYEIEGDLLPVRCPKCGANLAKTDLTVGDKTSVQKATAARESVEGLVRDAGKQKAHWPRILVAILIALGFIAGVAYVAWQSEMVGGTSVESVVGWRSERAVSELESLGFNVTTKDELSDQAAGFVLSQSPSSGRIPSGSTIVLSVSQERVMPDVEGMTAADAQKAIADQGASSTVTEVLSDSTAGTVIAASAATGATLYSTDTVTLSVARTPKVPSVIGSNQADATKALTDEGLAANVTYVAQSSTDQTAGTVIGTDPAVGSAAKTGQTVTLQVVATHVTEDEAAAKQIIQAVYTCDPTTNSGGVIGAALRPYLADSLLSSNPTDHDLWYSMVKRGRTNTVGSDALEQLPRAVDGDVTTSVTVGADGATNVACTFAVKWDWTRMGSAYAGVTSEDTRTVTISFDSDGKVVAFDDPQSDVPLYDVTS